MILVYLNGILMRPGAEHDYTLSSRRSIIFNFKVLKDATLDILAFPPGDNPTRRMYFMDRCYKASEEIKYETLLSATEH